MTAGQLFLPFYSKTIRHEGILHIYTVPDFSNFDNALDNSDSIYGKLWELRHIFDFLNTRYLKYYILFRGG
jgi:hypothetical protein